MKKALIIAITLFLITGCVEKRVEKQDQFDSKNAAAACEKLIGQFQSALKKELVTALTDGGAGKAISVCNLSAPLIADSFSTLPGFSIRRVSLKQRNQQFVPDKFEDSILTLFASLENDQPQRADSYIEGDESPNRYRYMKEIKTGQVCLNCHGDPDKFSKEVKEALALDYPDDPAVGYKLGDSRGAFSITMVFPEANQTIEKILGQEKVEK